MDVYNLYPLVVVLNNLFIVASFLCHAIGSILAHSYSMAKAYDGKMYFIIPYFYIKIRRFESDRKSTRLNSSHVSISYAVFCLKKINKFILYYIIAARITCN